MPFPFLLPPDFRPPDVLRSLASNFSSVRADSGPVQPGLPVVVKLVPPTAAGLQVTDILPIPITLGGYSQNVLFDGLAPPPPQELPAPFLPMPNVTGPMPAIVPLVGSVTGAVKLEGVPGQLTGLSGTLPLPIQLPVTLSVQWSVLKGDGTQAEGGSFTAPNGLTSPEATFIFRPDLVALINQPPEPVEFKIRAHVTLKAGPHRHSFDLPDIPVPVPCIAVPKLAAFFMHVDFLPVWRNNTGAALIVVPKDSPLCSVAQLTSALNALSTAIIPFRSLPMFAAMLPGLGQLISILSIPQGIVMRAADAQNEVKNLNNIRLLEKFWNDIEAEDVFSSMIFLGPSKSSVKCFNARNCSEGEGAFTLTLGDNSMIALIRNMHSGSPLAEPSGNTLTVNTRPKGGDFGDSLSSMKFP